jgi:hypothetical protein
MRKKYAKLNEISNREQEHIHLFQQTPFVPDEELLKEYSAILAMKILPHLMVSAHSRIYDSSVQNTSFFYYVSTSRFHFILE